MRTKKQNKLIKETQKQLVFRDVISGLAAKNGWQESPLVKEKLANKEITKVDVERLKNFLGVISCDWFRGENRLARPLIELKYVSIENKTKVALLDLVEIAQPVFIVTIYSQK